MKGRIAPLPFMKTSPTPSFVRVCRRILFSRKHLFARATCLVFVFAFAFATALPAATYYVATDGNDNDPGSATRPWRRPAYAAARLTAGDTLVIRPGRYVLRDHGEDILRLEAQGRADAWITLRGEPGQPYPVLAGTANLMAAIDLTGARYVRVEHLEITSVVEPWAGGLREGVDLGGSGETGNRADHIVLDDLRVHHVTEAALNLSGDVDDIVMSRLDLHHTGGPGISAPAGRAGGAGWTNVKLLHSRLWRIGYFRDGREEPSDWDRPDGIGMEASAGPLEVGWTRFEHIRGDGLDSKCRRTFVHHVVISNPSCDGLKLWGDGSRAENVLVHGDGDGNPANGSWASIVIDTEQPGTIELEHVTVDDQESRGNYPMYVQYSSPVAVTLRVRNCIFAHGGNTFYFGDSVRLDVANTLFHRTSNAALPVVHAQGRDWLPADLPRLGPGVISADPRFRRRAWGVDGDYRLAPDSPASNHSPTSTLREDLEGRPRPQGAGFDLGAYEGEASSVSRLTNLSIRTRVGTGNGTLIVGMTIGGAATGVTKPVLVRAVGPALTSFGLGDVLADPMLTIFHGATVVASNDNWGGGSALSTAFASVGAFALAPTAGKDAALYHSTMTPGGYSIQVTAAAASASGGARATGGIALAEIYDATPAGTVTGTIPRFSNVSARTAVGTGGDTLIAGFGISGSVPQKLLIRAIGPALAQFGVTDVLVDPRLELFSNETMLGANDDWSSTKSDQVTLTTAFQSVGAFSLAANSKDAALIVTLPAGSYTAQVSGVGGTTGIALVEIYELP